MQVSDEVKKFDRVAQQRGVVPQDFAELEFTTNLQLQEIWLRSSLRITDEDRLQLLRSYTFMDQVNMLRYEAEKGISRVVRSRLPFRSHYKTSNRK